MDKFLSTFGGSSSSTAGPSGNQSGRARGPGQLIARSGAAARARTVVANNMRASMSPARLNPSRTARARGLRPGTRAR